MNAVTETRNFHHMEILSAKLDGYVTQFHTFAQKSAESVLDMCRVAHEAKTNLDNGEFVLFCKFSNLEFKSATLSKMMKIGGRYEYLSQYKEQLPSAWTTLYRLAKMSDKEFQGGIQRKLVHPTMTGKELNSIQPQRKRPSRQQPLKSETDSTSESDQNLCLTKFITIKLGDQYAEVTLAELKAKLLLLCDEYHCELIEA